MSDAIETYLDELADQLRGSGRGIRRALAEAEDHLREAAAAFVVSGLAPDEAERRAVAAFGDPVEIAAGFGYAGDRGLPSLAQLVRGAWVLGGVGLVTIGVSGLVSQLLGTLYGWSFVAGDPVGVTYTADRCAEYQALAPTAPTCAQAALTDHFGEVVDFRVAAGVLGVLVLVSYGVLLRAARRGSLGSLLRRGALPPVAVPFAALALFGLAGVFLLGLGVAQGLGEGAGHGQGAAIADGATSLLAAVTSAAVLYRRCAGGPSRIVKTGA